MDRAYKSMQEVVITDESPVKINGDTISFNANMFKTKPNATVEDLIKKLPGMQVEKDGTVKAQGETVQKVYVDGKEFFNNDPKLATKNLAADMVDAVEVFDDMSEQATKIYWPAAKFFISKYPLLRVSVKEIRDESGRLITETVASLNRVAETESCKLPFTVPDTFCADAASEKVVRANRAK